MTQRASSAQIRAIQATRRAVGLDEDAYRALLGQYGVTSTTHLTIVSARQVIDRLKGTSNGIQPGSSRPASATVTGKYAGKLRALWISGWNLGVMRERDDHALIAFVQRQTGLQHTRFLTDPADARRAIEALKKWLAREAGVQWPKANFTDRDMVEVLGLAEEAPRKSAPAMKRAVSDAQMRRATELEVIWPEGCTRVTLINDPETWQPILGRAIRAAMKRRG